MKDVTVSEKLQNNLIKVVCESHKLDDYEIIIDLIMFNRMFKTKHKEFNISKQFHIYYVGHTNKIH